MSTVGHARQLAVCSALSIVRSAFSLNTPPVGKCWQQVWARRAGRTLHPRPVSRRVCAACCVVHVSSAACGASPCHPPPPCGQQHGVQWLQLAWYAARIICVWQSWYICGCASHHAAGVQEGLTACCIRCCFSAEYSGYFSSWVMAHCGVDAGACCPGSGGAGHANGQGVHSLECCSWWEERMWFSAAQSSMCRQHWGPQQRAKASMPQQGPRLTGCLHLPLPSEGDFAGYAVLNASAMGLLSSQAACNAPASPLCMPLLRRTWVTDLRCHQCIAPSQLVRYIRCQHAVTRVFVRAVCWHDGGVRSSGYVAAST